MSAAIDKLSEFFLLRTVEEEARTVPEATHITVAHAHARAKQRRDAAEALWSAGHRVEALRLARDAVAALAEVEPGHDTLLPVTELPELESELTPEHGQVYRNLINTFARARERQLGKALDVAHVKVLRLGRIGAAAAIAAAVLACAWWVIRTPKVLKATASGQWDERYEPGKAVDGNEKSDWLLPERQGGWIEVALVPPRKVSKLKLMSARNLPWADRGTRDFHVDVYSNGEVIKQLDGSFGPPPQSQAADWQKLPLNVHADKIRITVKSSYLNGGGFAEIEAD